MSEPSHRTNEQQCGLRMEIEHAINRWSAENGSNTPDFILAHFLMDCLKAFDSAVHARECWHGRIPKPIEAVTALRRVEP